MIRKATATMSLVILALILLLFSGKTGEEHTIISNTFSENAISITYPTISGLRDFHNQETINHILRKVAFNEFDSWCGVRENDNNSLSLNVEYSIISKSNSIVCVLYTGFASVEGASYPRDLFVPVTIDINSGARLRLSDWMEINEDFVAQIRDCLARYIHDGPHTLSEKSNALQKDAGYAAVYEQMLEKSDDDFIRLLVEADSDDNPGCYSYITKDVLGISFVTYNTAGDHFEIEILRHQVDGLITDKLLN